MAETMRQGVKKCYIIPYSDGVILSRGCSKSPGQTQLVASLVALVSPLLYWQDIPGRLMTRLPEREDHTSCK